MTDLDRRILLRRYLGRLERRIVRFRQRSRRFSWGRLALALVGVGAAFGAFQGYGPGAGWAMIALFGAAFFVAARQHARLEAGLERHLLWRSIKVHHLARLTHDWAALPPSEAVEVAAGHPFAADFNLTGPRSLHHLLDTTASAGGSRHLAAWLLDAEPDLAAAQARQRQVRALVPLSLFRDRLTLLTRLTAEGTEPTTTRWDDAPLLAWLRRDDHLPALRTWLLILSGLAAVNIALVLGHILGALPMLWPFSLFIYLAVYLSRVPYFKHLFDESQDLETMLARFAPVLGYLERYPFPADGPLAERCAPLRTDDRRPSRVLRHLHRIATAAALTRSELLLVLFNLVMPWEMLFTVLLDRTKRHLRTVLPDWFEVWYEMEALSALAHHADDAAGTTFPTLVPEARTPVFEASALGHPLLPSEARVRNDFALGGPRRIGLITGSNMSGKSTFLRTVGINLVLAFAGGAVDAAALKTGPFRLFSSMNVSDSVQDGLSFFYAEVKRLRALLDALRTPHAAPLFFFIDEIFRGTNNRERLLGSQAYVRALAHEQGVGLISTHDLELVQLEDEIPTLDNYHFREDVESGQMIFDYTLRTGPCPTTNALVIMQIEGLPVSLEAEAHVAQEAHAAQEADAGAKRGA